MAQVTHIPGFPDNFQQNLPVQAQMAVSRPGWPVHSLSSSGRLTPAG